MTLDLQNAKCIPFITLLRDNKNSLRVTLALCSSDGGFLEYKNCFFLNTKIEIYLELKFLKN